MSQLIRSAASIGANYTEANGPSSKKDFKNKIHIRKKEFRESKHRLYMISVAMPNAEEEVRRSWKEAQELTGIWKNHFNIKKLKH